MDNTAIYREKWCAEGYDEDRFGGAFGQYLHDREIECLLADLADCEGGVLDLGCGTGKLSLPLLQQGRPVVSVDASAEMLGIACRKADEGGLAMAPAVCDSHDLSFADGAFEGVVCSRVLMHLSDWRKSVAELCRVSRRVVVIDFPPRWSFASVNGVLKRFRNVFEPRTRGYNSFSAHEVIAELRRNGFEPMVVRRDYFLPVAFHRKLGKPQLSLAMERLFRMLGLVAAFGAPVTVKAVRQGAGRAAPR